jgi:transposase
MTDDSDHEIRFVNVGHWTTREDFYQRFPFARPGAVATVAEQLGISRATGYKWVRRYRADGLPGLKDRSSRPHRSPRRSSDEETATILRARARRRYGPARLVALTGHPRSTIYGVLGRAGLSRLRDTDRVTAAPVRYVACHPGALTSASPARRSSPHDRIVELDDVDPPARNRPPVACFSAAPSVEMHPARPSCRPVGR